MRSFAVDVAIHSACVLHDAVPSVPGCPWICLATRGAARAMMFEFEENASQVARMKVVGVGGGGGNAVNRMIED